MPLKAVAFDVDGTLYPNPSMYLRSLGWALSRVRLLRSLERVRKTLREHPEPGQEFQRSQARLVAQDLGLTPEAAYQRIHDQVYTDWYRVFRGLKPFQGLAAFIKELRAAGLKTAVLSDFPIGSRLEDLGLAGAWDASFSSEETGYLKPNPQSFLLLAERLGLPPSDVLYVGNSYTYDVMGATAACMPCAHLTRSPRPDSPAVLSFSRYSELREFVFRSVGDPGYDALTGRVSC